MERDIQTKTENLDLKISTHTLTWSVTSEDGLISDTVLHFNSHAHVERDIQISPCIGTNWDFNSHAHVERDIPRVQEQQ